MYTTNIYFYNSSINIGFISFFSSSEMHQSYHLLECNATGINSLLLLFKYFAFFSFNMESQRSDMNDSTRIIIIKIIIKIILSWSILGITISLQLRIHLSLKTFSLKAFLLTSCCSRLRLWVGYYIYFKFTRVFFCLMFLIDV